MTVDEVVDYYKTGTNLQRCTGIARQTFVNWTRYGFIPPLMQMRLDYITGGKLKADLTELKREWDEYSELDKASKI